ncbi:MAG: peptidoglycan DD-metalloendopeptidase family protein [Porphyromonadaceae bacterium]|nr:peptidoglycan DD-metalloendopeptidase family protein [Porphyromonadaceae bacterium]
MDNFSDQITTLRTPSTGLWKMKSSLFRTGIFSFFLLCTFFSLKAQEADSLLQRHMTLQQQNLSLNKELPLMLSIDDSATYSQRLKQEYGIAPAGELYGDVWVNRWVNPYRQAGIVLPDSFAIHVGNYCMPIIGKKTSDYGFRHYRMHRGVDLRLAIGDTVRTAFAGQVRFTNYERRGYGYYIVIRHANGLETVYGHLSRFLVKEGDIVKVGEPIALGGNTGRSTGSHLHFEIRFLGLDLNPNELFDFQNNTIRNEVFMFRSAPYRKGTETYYANGVTYSVYRVKKGDTLSGIARKYRTSVNTLCRLNKISPKRTLKIGQPIRID